MWTLKINSGFRLLRAKRWIEMWLKKKLVIVINVRSRELMRWGFCQRNVRDVSVCLVVWKGGTVRLAVLCDWWAFWIGSYSCVNYSCLGFSNSYIDRFNFIFIYICICIYTFIYTHILFLWSNRDVTSVNFLHFTSSETERDSIYTHTHIYLQKGYVLRWVN